MALRKIIIAVDCVDDAQKDRVQDIFNEISSMRMLNGEKVEGMYPFFHSHQSELRQLFDMVSRNGLKSLVSGQGVALMTKLAKR